MIWAAFFIANNTKKKSGFRSFWMQVFITGGCFTYNLFLFKKLIMPFANGRVFFLFWEMKLFFHSKFFKTG